jgi:hypothetical protein
MNNSISEIKLNKNITIYKSSFDWKYPKDILINKVKQNLSYIGLDDLTTSNFHIQSKEINYVKEYCRNVAIKILGKDSSEVSSWAEQFWIYLSDRTTYVDEFEARAKLYHDHPITLTTVTSRPITSVKTDITYCFYLSVPTDLKNNEGKLMFKDEDGNEVGLIPQTGDIIFFSPKYLHKPNFIPSSNQKRIVICSNLTINLKENLDKESLI